MRTLSALVAVGALFLAAASAPVIGAVVFALLLFLPLFLLALVGVLSTLENRTVRQHETVMDGRRWRDGS
jgi:hypothetical protein